MPKLSCLARLVGPILRVLCACRAGRQGTVAVMTALAAPAILGVAGLGASATYWQLTKDRMQGAADAAAYSAAVAYNDGGDIRNEAAAAAAGMGFATGSGDVSLTVNQPPGHGNYTNNNVAVEVILSQPQPLAFASLFLHSSPTVSARAVALPQSGSVCVLALDTNPSDFYTIYANTAASAQFNNCSVASNLVNSFNTGTVAVGFGAFMSMENLLLRVGSQCNFGWCMGTLSVTKSIRYHQPTVTDPYASRPMPSFSGCSHINLVVVSSQVLSPGVYCGTGGKPALTITGGTVLMPSSTPPSSTRVLQFTSTSGLSVGMSVSDETNASAIPAGTTITALSPSSVTLSNSAQGVSGSDSILFTPAGGVTVTLNPGIYILDGQGGGNCVPGAGPGGPTKPSNCYSGDLSIANAATVTGSGVTVILTTSSTGSDAPIYIGNLNVDSTSALAVAAPSSGSTAGMALWQDARAPYPPNPGFGYYMHQPGVNTIGSGNAANITGALYFPSQGVIFSGGNGTATCTQIVAWAVQVLQSANVNYGNCQNTGVAGIGNKSQIVE
jgi:Flp pilus assembly protein TadG